MRPKLGELLIEAGAVASEDVDAALADQSAGEPSRLGDLLLSTGKITPAALARALAIQLGLPFADLSYVAPEASALIPLEFQRAHRLVLFRLDRDGGATRVHVALSDPTLIEVVDELRSQLKREVIVHVAPIDDIENVHAALAGEGAGEPVVMGEVLDEEEVFMSPDPDVTAEVAMPEGGADFPFPQAPASAPNAFAFPAQPAGFADLPSDAAWDAAPQPAGAPELGTAPEEWDFGAAPTALPNHAPGGLSAATDGFDFAESGAAAGDGPGLAQPPDEFDLAGAAAGDGPGLAQPGGFDFAGAAAAQPALDDLSRPPAALSTDGLDFGEAPAAQPLDGFDFGATPAQADGFDFGAAAVAPPPAVAIARSVAAQAQEQGAPTEPWDFAEPPPAAQPTTEGFDFAQALAEPPVPVPSPTAQAGTPASVTEEELFGSMDLGAPTEETPLSMDLADEIGRHDLAPPQQDFSGFSALAAPLGDPAADRFGARASSPSPAPTDLAPLTPEQPLTAAANLEPEQEGEVLLDAEVLLETEPAPQPVLEVPKIVPAPLISPILDVLPVSHEATQKFAGAGLGSEPPRIPSFAIPPEVPVEPRRSPVEPLRRPAATLGRIALKRVAVNRVGIAVPSVIIPPPPPPEPVVAATKPADPDLPDWMRTGTDAVPVLPLLAPVESGEVSPGLRGLLARIESGELPPGPVLASLLRLLVEHRLVDAAAATAALEKL